MTDGLIRCRDECGATVPADHILGSGWEYLETQRAYRCTACWRALRAAGSMRGTDTQTVDALPADSIGALRRETASGIAAPTVKA